MKNFIKILPLLAAFAGALTAGAQSTPSVLSVSDDSMTPTIIMPESFETDTKAMSENWYLKNYTVLDYKPDGRSEGDFSDETLRRTAHRN